jgi:hypothetical protein
VSRSLTSEIAELLHADGPLDIEDVRTRLMVSSRTQFEAAVYMLTETGEAERLSGGHRSGMEYLRLKGDQRPLPDTIPACSRRGSRLPQVHAHGLRFGQGRTPARRGSP